MLTKLIEQLAQGDETRLKSLTQALDWEVKYTPEQTALIEKWRRKYEVEMNYTTAWELERSEKNCAACKGISACKEGGLRLTPKVVDDELRLEYEPCERRSTQVKVDRLNKAYRLAGLPNIYDKLKATKMQQALIEEMSGAENAWYYIYGGLASGKTFAAVRAAKRLIMRGKSVRFYNTAELLSRLNPQNVQMTLDELMHPEVLILDDFGAQYKSEWSNDRLFMVIDGRYRKQGITIITSNYELGAADELNLMRINDRIRRRAKIIRLTSS